MTKFLLLTFYCQLLVHCSDKPVINTIPKAANTPMTRLGNSEYLLQLPSYFTLAEVHGTEGQVGYNILPIDTTNEMFGFIEIEHGEPIGRSRPDIWGVVQDTIRSVVLNEQASWPLHKSGTGYLTAGTSVAQISARVWSSKRNEIDSLIAIVSTLTKE